MQTEYRISTEQGMLRGQSCRVDILPEAESLHLRLVWLIVSIEAIGIPVPDWRVGI